MPIANCLESQKAESFLRQIPEDSFRIKGCKEAIWRLPLLTPTLPLPPPLPLAWQTHPGTSVRCRPFLPAWDRFPRPFSACKAALVEARNGAPIRLDYNSPLRIPESAEWIRSDTPPRKVHNTCTCKCRYRNE